MIKNLFDEYCWSRQKKVLTHDNHHVKGLGGFAHASYSDSPENETDSMHIHPNMIEIHVILVGQCYTRIEEEGELSSYVCSGGEAIVTWPFELHLNGSSVKEPCEFYAFQIDISDPGSILGLSFSYSYHLYNQLTELKERHFIVSQAQIELLAAAFEWIGRLTEDAVMTGVQYLTCFLFSLKRQPAASAGEQREVDSGIQKSIEYLREHIHETLRLEELAGISGYSLSRFKYKFKHEIGITPAEYITLQKIEVAKTRLIETDISITELAYSLGFSTSNYFSSVFKKIISCTPREYRRMYRKGSMPVQS
ncbi:MAG: helix-turn-helix transcriptional regulator [Lachnospiraceae bacterium]|nr:helix-turn-helix transcriptional regulator [Lachnospiraceae bacterium]